MLNADKTACVALVCTAPQVINVTKTACFTQQLKFAKDIPFELFQQNSEVFKKDIVNTDFNFLNRFKKTNNQAYFYWYKCLELMNLLN